MQEEVASLKIELAELRADFDSLQAEVTRLRRLIVGLQTGGSERSSPALSRAAYPESEGSFSLVGQSSARTSVLTPGPEQARAVSGLEQAFAFAGPEQALGVSGPEQALGSSGPVQASALPRGAATITWDERDNIARGIGAWIRRCLDGLPRQTSGRDHNPLQSRYWVAVRSISGETHNPPLVFSSWSSAKGCVKRGSYTGDSIFFGVPSQREASTAIFAADLQWGGQIQG